MTLKGTATAVMILSGIMLLGCLLNNPKESRYFTMIASAILFTGSQITLAILSQRDHRTKEDPHREP
jgi:hypothetical protein